MGRSNLISLNTTQAHIQTTSRMNKLLMLAFLVTLMGLMATAAPQEEMDDMELEEFDIEEAIASREAREAGRRRKGQNKKNRKRLGRKRTAKKAKKNGRKTKNQKAVRKSQGRRNNKDSRSGLCRASTDYTCLINAMTYLNLTKTQVANYLKQQGRIIAANKTGEKKNGKKGIFAATAQRIIRSGGGNSAALSCQGSTTSNGAKNLTALAALLNGCEAKVKTACSTENMPLPNITEVSACVDAKMTFKGMVDKCQMMKDNGTEACDCWSNDNFTALVTTIGGCKLSDDQKAVTAQLKNCKTEFSACKQAEDDGMKAMSSCLTSKITSVSSSLVCSDDEKTSLMTSSTDLASAKESVDGSLATIKEDLEIATGSAPTDEEISAATSSPTSTSATSARRNIVARHLLNRFNLN